MDLGVLAPPSAERVREVRETALIAAMPDGAVTYLDDEPGMVELQRGDVTIVIPNETPDAVADALFSIAAVLGPDDGPSRTTLDGLVSMCVGVAALAEIGSES